MTLTSGTRLGPYEILSPIGCPSSLSIRWYGRPVRLGDDDDSGLDVGETLPGSHDLWFHELENASFDVSFPFIRPRVSHLIFLTRRRQLRIPA